MENGFEATETTFSVSQLFVPANASSLFVSVGVNPRIYFGRSTHPVIFLFQVRCVLRQQFDAGVVIQSLSCGAGRIAVRGKADDGKLIIRVFDGDSTQLTTIPSRCPHYYSDGGVLFTSPDRILEACSSCKVARCYNTATGLCSTVYEGDVRSMSAGPDNTVITTVEEQLLQLEWDGEREVLHRPRPIKQFDLFLGPVHYVPEFRVVVVQGLNNLLEALALHDGSCVWEKRNLSWGCWCMCSDSRGRLYVPTGDTVEVLAGDTGEKLRSLDIMGLCLGFLDHPPRLVVGNVGSPTVRVYDIDWQE